MKIINKNQLKNLNKFLKHKNQIVFLNNKISVAYHPYYSQIVTNLV